MVPKGNRGTVGGLTEEEKLNLNGQYFYCLSFYIQKIICECCGETVKFE